MKQPAVYILSNRLHGTLYTGVTSDIVKRVYQHKEGLTAGFSKRYGCNRLVWYELHQAMESAILRKNKLKVDLAKRK